MSKDAFIIYKDNLIELGDYLTHTNYVRHNYEQFGITKEQFESCQQNGENADFELLNLAIRKGLIQVRNIGVLKTTFINIKDHSMIDKLVDGILKYSDRFQYKMQVTFLDTPQYDGIANNIMELYNL